MRSAFFRAVSDADLVGIVRKLMAVAKAGDMAAARLLLGYALGRMPNEVPEPEAEQERVAVETADGAIVLDGRVYRRRDP